MYIIWKNVHIYCILKNWFCTIGCSDFDLFFKISSPSCVSGGVEIKKDQILNMFFLTVSLCFLYFTIVFVQKVQNDPINSTFLSSCDRSCKPLALLLLLKSISKSLSSRLFTSPLMWLLRGEKPEPEFLNICWRLKSRLFKKSCLFKGQRVQQGSNRENFLCVNGKDTCV